MKELFQLKFLEGRRTQVAAVVIAGLTLALNLGWITAEQHGAITGFLMAIGLLTAAVHQPKP